MVNKKTAANAFLYLLLGVLLIFALIIGLSGRTHAAPKPSAYRPVALQGHDNETPLGDIAKPTPPPEKPEKQGDLDDSWQWLSWNDTRVVNQI